MLKDYKASLDYIFSLTTPENQTTKPGIHLDRIKKFLDKLNNPQNTYPTIHITGTSGKGSVTNFIAHVLASTGLKVGMHTSPYLTKVNEKFQILNPNRHRLSKLQQNPNDLKPQSCTDTEFTDLANWAQNHITQSDGLTFYETLIAMMFQYFADQKVDVAIIEVGMGGKLDATNVINSTVQVLNSVGLDHTEILGDTLQEIIRDKMMIMQPNSVFISGVLDPDLNQIIKSHADELNSDLKILDRDFEYKTISSSMEGNIFDFHQDDFETQDLKTQAIGEFQIHNATIAVQTVLEFARRKLPLQNLYQIHDAIHFGVANTVIPARFELVSQEPTIIVDGAHNDSKIESLSKSLEKYIGKRPIKILFSCKAGKDLSPMLHKLKNLNITQWYICEFSKQYYTQISSYTNAQIRQDIRNVFGDNIEIFSFTNPAEAYKMFKSALQKEDIGLITGSLYMIGDLYSSIKSQTIS